MNSVIDPLKEVEFVAEQILSDKQMIINFDKQRQKNREALNCIKKKDENEKIWISFGNMLVKVNNRKCKDIITQDQKNIDENINNIRDNLKQKMFNLRKLEGKPELRGYNLKPLDKKELSSLKDIIPEVVNM